MSMLEWMAWTPPIAIFFVAIALLLICMTLWEWHSPTTLRRGMLPIATTRGDRLFIGLLTAAYINLAWTGLTDVTQWGGAALGAVATILVMRWG